MAKSIPPIGILNVRGLVPGDPSLVYVGRACRGWPRHELANPFHIVVDTIETRLDCLIAYQHWLLGQRALSKKLDRLWAAMQEGRLPLGCWCKPLACHADVLADVLGLYLAGKPLKEID